MDVNLRPNDSVFARYTQNDSDLLFINAETFRTSRTRGGTTEVPDVSPSHIFSNNVVNNCASRSTGRPDRSAGADRRLREPGVHPGQIVGDISISGYKRFGSDRNTPRAFFRTRCSLPTT